MFFLDKLYSAAQWLGSNLNTVSGLDPDIDAAYEASKVKQQQKVENLKLKSSSAVVVLDIKCQPKL